MRVGLATLLLAQGLATAANLFDFYGSSALLQGAVNDFLVPSPCVPKLSWILAPLESAGVAESTALAGIFVAYMAALGVLLIGLRVRVAAAIAAVLHTMFLSSGFYAEYGVDRFAQIALFYCISMPCSGQHTSESATFWRRMLQVHICIAYVASGLEKSTGAEWWNGEAIWRALMLPGFQQGDVSWLAAAPLLPKILGLGTLALEAGYPLFMGLRRTRPFCYAAIVGMHLGIAFGMGMPFFAALMILWSTCAFMIPAATSRPSKPRTR